MRELSEAKFNATLGCSMQPLEASEASDPNLVASFGALTLSHIGAAAEHPDAADGRGASDGRPPLVLVLDRPLRNDWSMGVGRVAVFVVGAVLLAGCYHPCGGRPVPLFHGLLSQQTQEEVRRQLPTGQKWQVAREDKGPTDGRPRFDFVLISVGTLVDRGHTGDVQLRFYNDRLMSVYFTPKESGAYFDAVKQMPGAKVLENQIVALPEGVNVWRVGAVRDGPIEWFDPCLRDENNSWIMAYS